MQLFREMRDEKRNKAALDESPDTVALTGLLAPVDESDLTTYLPLDMPAILDEEDLVGPTAEEVGRDNMEVFDAGLFIDSYLVPNLSTQSSSGDALMKEAFDRYYVQDKRLRGLHSLMFTDEVALIAVPDAVHREWAVTKTPAPLPPLSSPPITSPPAPKDHSLFADCDVKEAAPPPMAKRPEPTAPRLPVLMLLEKFDFKPLVQIQQAAFNFCQARRDALCVLTLPQHFEKQQCIEWLEEFRRQLGLPSRPSLFGDPRDTSDLSYAAVYHPWLLIPDSGSPDNLRAVPGDGAVCGMIAARERARQVWVAPANLPLNGVLELTPTFNAEEWADLFDLQFNLIRQEPRDFRPMSAHTLSDESIWRQVSVRRLMILLRKLAVERGMDFVFESNHTRFREGIRLMLEEMLRFMFKRGAFAGATAEQSYRIVTDSSVNTPESVDAGRFIAQIQVAPSQPLEFITVLLTRIGEDLLQAREA